MNKLYKYVAKNVIETKDFAFKLAKYLEPGSVLTLEGELGSGKTTFTQGLAEGLEITQIVNSPTFAIIKEYRGKHPLYHMDVYRLGNDTEDLGFDEYFYGEGITVVEWASIIYDYLPSQYLNINLQKIDENKRIIHLEPLGEKYAQICEEFFNDENSGH